MKINEITETKKKTDVKWIAKLKDGKTKTIWAPTKYDAKQKLGTSILIQGGYTIKKAPLGEDASAGATASGAVATATSGLGVAYANAPHGTGTKNTDKKRKKKTETTNHFILRR